VAILHGGALPWLVQFAGLAALFFVAARRFLGDRKSRTVCVAVPLLVGLFWWSGLVLQYWNTELLGAVVDLLGYRMGGGSLFDEILFATAGPLVHPVRLHGPYALSGVEFLWTGLSTTIVLCWLGIGIAWLSRETPEGNLNRKSWLRVALVVLVYTSPVYLKFTLSLSEAFALAF
jgi:hypothetical protein